MVLGFGARVGEIAFDDNRVGTESFDRIDRAPVHHLGIGLFAVGDREDRPELFGGAEQPAFRFAEMHVVHGCNRCEPLARRQRQRRELGRQLGR